MNDPQLECPNEDVLSRFATGSDLASEAIHDHVVGCRNCRMLVAAVLTTEGALLADPLIGVKFGRYEAVERIGAGASGLVYRARDPMLERYVAIKILRSLSVAQRERLVHEREALAKLNHPNVVHIYDTGEVERDDEIEVWFAVELVDGGSLRSYARERELSGDEISTLARQAAVGLAAIHSVGLVHRDIKPDNLLVHLEGRLLVSDLGLSRSEKGGDSARKLEGTPLYMAPELLDGSPATPASDQYALCLAIAEVAIRGTPGFVERGSELVSALVTSGLHREAASAIARGLELDPADRHESVDALANALTGTNPTSHRSRLFVVGAMVLAAGVGIGLYAIQSERHDESPCATERQEIAERFGDERLTETFGPTQNELRELAEERLATLEKARSAACEERVRKSSNTGARARNLRIAACLESQLSQLDRVLSLIASQPDLETSAKFLIGDIPTPEACSLAVGLPPIAVPDDKRVDVARFRVELSQIKILGMAANHKQAAERAGAIAADVEAVGHLPLTADLRFAQAAYANALGDQDSAQRFAKMAFEAAERSGYDRVRAQATSVFLSAREISPELIPGYIATIEAVIGRATDSPTLRSSLRRKLATFYGKRGEFEQALEQFSAALADLEAVTPPNHQALGDSALGAAAAAARLSKHDVATRYFSIAVENLREAYGPDHPRVALARTFEAQSLGGQGKFKEASAVLKLATPVLKESLGPSHPTTLMALTTECRLLIDLDEFEDADKSCTSVLEGSKEIDKWNALTSLAQLRKAEKRWADADKLYARALAAMPPSVAPVDRADIEFNYAMLLLKTDRRKARALLRRVRDVWTSGSNAGQPRFEKDLAKIDSLLSER